MGDKMITRSPRSTGKEETARAKSGVSASSPALLREVEDASDWWVPRVSRGEGRQRSAAAFGFGVGRPISEDQWPAGE